MTKAAALFRRFDHWMTHYDHRGSSHTRSFAEFPAADPSLFSYGATYDDYVELAALARHRGYDVEVTLSQDHYGRALAEHHYRATELDKPDVSRMARRHKERSKVVRDIANAFCDWLERYDHFGATAAESYADFVTHSHCILELGATYQEYAAAAACVCRSGPSVPWIVSEAAYHRLFSVAASRTASADWSWKQHVKALASLLVHFQSSDRPGRLLVQRSHYGGTSSVDISLLPAIDAVMTALEELLLLLGFVFGYPAGVAREVRLGSPEAALRFRRRFRALLRSADLPKQVASRYSADHRERVFEFALAGTRPYMRESCRPGAAPSVEVVLGGGLPPQAYGWNSGPRLWLRQLKLATNAPGQETNCSKCSGPEFYFQSHDDATTFSECVSAALRRGVRAREDAPIWSTNDGS